MKNLVEKAKQIGKKTNRRNFEITPEVIELAKAWQKDEVTITQCEKVLGVKEHNKIYAILARALKAGSKPLVEKLTLGNKPTNDTKPLMLARHKDIGKSPDSAPSKY